MLVAIKAENRVVRFKLKDSKNSLMHFKKDMRMKNGCFAERVGEMPHFLTPRLCYAGAEMSI
jgi:hypothetical protein